MKKRSSPSWRAFTLFEVVFASASVVVALALLGLMAGRTRKLGQLGESMANLRRIGELSSCYAADFQKATWTFSRQGDEQFTDIAAAAAQALDIMQRIGNDPNLPFSSSWIPHPFYSHLVLLDHARMAGPSLTFISPGDRNRLNWALDIPGFRAGVYGPNQPSNDPEQWRWSYSSSYELNYAFFAPDSGETVSQSGSHYPFQVPLTPRVMGRRRFTEVVYPSNKVMMWDTFGWYFGPRVAFSLIPEARLPVLFADASVRVRTRKAYSVSDNNWGWNPRVPTQNSGMGVNYVPNTWEPPVPSGGLSFTTYGYHRWTRWGLRGRDFDGAEVTQP